MSRIYGTKEGQAPYTEGNQSRIELTRNYHIECYNCKLTVNHTNTSAVFKNEDLLSLINSIQIIADGNETIKSVPASKFHISNIMVSGRKGLQEVNKADGTKESYVWFRIYFAVPYLARPMDTVFNTAVYSSLNMLINWANASKVGTGIVINNAKLDVYSHALTGYARNEGEKIIHFKETYLKKEVTATTNQLTIDLPTKQMYKAFSIVSTIDDKRVTNVINSITLKSGTTVIVQLDADEIKSLNYNDYAVQSSGDLDGVYIVDFLTRDRLSDLLNTIGQFNTLELVFDVTKQAGLNELHIYSDIIESTNKVEVQAPKGA